MWSKELWELREACFYWMGFPLQWTWEELFNPSNHPTSSTEEESKALARVQRIHTMYFEISDKVSKKLMHGYLKNGVLYVTPYEFIRYAKSKSIQPFSPSVFQELEQSNRLDYISILEGWARRSSPRLASFELKTKNGGNPLWSPKKIHRELAKECAKKIDTDAQIKEGIRLTPKSIYSHPEFQTCLKRFRDPCDRDIIITYSPSLIIKNWIPQGIGRRPNRGRPLKRKRKNKTKDQKEIIVISSIPRHSPIQVNLM